MKEVKLDHFILSTIEVFPLSETLLKLLNYKSAQENITS